MHPSQYEHAVPKKSTAKNTSVAKGDEPMDDEPAFEALAQPVVELAEKQGASKHNVGERGAGGERGEHRQAYVVERKVEPAHVSPTLVCCGAAA